MNKVAIIYYHRIDDYPADYNFTNVKPENFKGHMDVLSDGYDVISLKELYNRQAFNHKRNAVVITFDDGYADVYNNAAPIISSYGFPFACFVTTGNIFKGGENWTDIVLRVAFEPIVFRDKCEIIVRGEKRTFRTDRFEDRLSFYKEIRRLFMELSNDELESILEYLLKWSNTPLNARETHRIMNCDEIKAISEMGADIGAHTVSHPFFSHLCDEEIRKEVYESKYTLERITSKKVKWFSYPFGDCPKRARTVLDECGYDIALTSNKGLVSEDSDIMYLPRNSIRDYGKDEFAQYLESIFFNE